MEPKLIKVAGNEHEQAVEISLRFKKSSIKVIPVEHWKEEPAPVGTIVVVVVSKGRTEIVHFVNSDHILEIDGLLAGWEVTD